MRKLIAMLAVCAGAMGLHAVTTGTSFEGLIPEGAERTNYVDVLSVAAAELSGTPGQYWDVTAENVDTLVEEDGFLVTTNYGEHAAFSYDRNGQLTPWVTTAAKSYLHIATKKDKSVTRFAQANHDPVTIDTEGSYYFDSLVQFTAFETNKLASTVLGDDGKLAIWLQSDIDPNTLDPTSTNLIVSAGYLASDGAGGYVATATNYVCRVLDDDVDLNDGGWHRVTVKAFDNIYDGYNVPAFAIAIDGYAVEIMGDIATAGIDENQLTGRAKNYYNNNQRLFPSAKIGAGSKTITSVSFQGIGSVDDLVFSDEADIPWMSDAAFGLNLGEHVASAEYSVGAADPVVISGSTMIPYSQDMVVTISNVVYATGYMGKGCGSTDTGVSIETNGASYVVTVAAANKSVTVEAQAIGATIVDSSGTPVTTYFATASDAFLAIRLGEAGTGPYTVTLSADATEGIELLGDNQVTLDLAGNNIYAGEKSAAISVGEGIEVGVSLTIEDSVGGGKVIGDSANFVSAVFVDTGTLIIDGGTYEGLVNADPDAGNTFTITGDGVKFTKADIDDGGTYDYTLDAVVAGLGAGYELAEGTGGDAGYYIVRETPTTATVTFDLNGGEGSIAPVVVDINDTVAEPSPAPTKTGYTFDCWKLNDAEFDFDTPITADITLVAAWTINSYDVTFTTNAVEYVVQSVDYNDTATKPADPVGAAGKAFDYWQQTGHDAAYDFDTLVTSNITLAAIWSNYVYTVTYNLDLAGATNVAGNITSYTVETPEFTLLPAGCENYNFLGWTNSVGETVSEIAGGATGDVTLYAKWESAGGGLDPEHGTTDAHSSAATPAAAETEVKSNIIVPAGAAAAVSKDDYADYFKYGVSGTAGDYTVSITGIVESVEADVAASAVVRLTDGEATAITVPAGLYYKITPSADLPISGTSVKGLSTGSVPIKKPAGTDKGFYKIELNATPISE